jgi:hypothetical protein
MRAQDSGLGPQRTSGSQTSVWGPRPGALIPH